MAEFSGENKIYKRFDLEKVLERVENDFSLLQEIIEIFLEESDKLLQSIFKSIKQKHNESVRAAVHTFKGAVGNFYAPRSLELAGHISEFTQQNDYSNAKEYCLLLEKEIKMLNFELAEVAKSKESVCF